MARTLVGRLQLVVQAMGLGEAKKVEGSVSSIEAAAKRLSKAEWGQGFQRQLEKIGLSAGQLDQVRRSWANLNAEIAGRGLGAAQRKSQLSAWKTATVAHFSAIESKARAANSQMDRSLRLIKQLARPVMIGTGGATFGYASSVWGREALTAASEARRVQAEAKYAGLSADERGRIDVRANDLSARYRLEKSAIYDVMKEASLSMPSTDAALAVSDEMARAFTVFSNMFGSDGAIAGLRNFNKAMDNIEKVTPAEYSEMLENYAKAQQVVGKDMDPSAFAEAIKYSRTSGKVFGTEFLSQWLPMLIAESGGSDSGTQLRALFDQFIVGRASKQSLAVQRSYGLRDDADRLLEQQAFGENPLTWIYDVLLPKLEAQGVDRNDEVELARVVGELTNNRLSSDLVTRAILSFEQYRRLVEERLPNALGLKAAEDIQKDNPFAAYDGFKNSLKNLSDALLPMENISGGLNSFADTINAFTQKVRDSDPTVKTGAAVAGGALALWGTAKVFAGVWGLITAGTNLNIAAAALQAAAVAQGGKIPGAGTGAPVAAAGGAGGWWKAAGLASVMGGLATLVQSTGDTPGETYDDQVRNQGEAKKGLRRLLGLDDGHAEERERDTSLGSMLGRISAALERGETVIPTGDWRAPAYEPPRTRGGQSDVRPMPTGEVQDTTAQATLDTSAATSEAQRAGGEIERALSVHAKPTVDNTALRETLSLAQQAAAVIQGLGPAARQARSEAGRRVESEMRRSFSDYGVAP